MQELLVISASLGVLFLLALGISRRYGSSAPNARLIGVGLGVAVGCVAAVAVLIPHVDLIPDDLEPVIWTVVIITMSLVLLRGFHRRS